MAIGRLRVSVVAALAALVVASGAPDAIGSPAASTITVVSRSGLPSSFALADVDSAPDTCSDTAGATSVRHVVGPRTPPLGRGSLALAFTTGAELSDAFSIGESALTAFSVSSLGSPGAAHAVILADQPNGGGWELTSSLPAGSGWSSTDILADPSMLWWFRTSSAASWSPHGQGDYADFVSSDPGVTLTGLAVTGDTCTNGQTQSLNIDDLHVGIGGATTIYDFEVPLLADTVVGRLTRMSTISGGPLTPSVTFTSSGHPVANVSLTAWRRAAHAAAYSKIGTVTTNAAGIATGPLQRPTVTTTYRWTFASDGKYASATSATATVRVARKVTLHLRKSTVARGSPVVATGTAAPKRKGTSVTLWRKTSNGKVKLAKVRVHRDGTYVISKSLPAGKYRLLVTVARDSFNSAGTSPLRRVTVA